MVARRRRTPRTRRAPLALPTPAATGLLCGSVSINNPHHTPELGLQTRLDTDTAHVCRLGEPRDPVGEFGAKPRCACRCCRRESGVEMRPSPRTRSHVTHHVRPSHATKALIDLSTPPSIPRQTTGPRLLAGRCDRSRDSASVATSTTTTSRTSHNNRRPCARARDRTHPLDRYAFLTTAQRRLILA